jgi:LacI family transcriptional regulator
MARNKVIIDGDHQYDLRVLELRRGCSDGCQKYDWELSNHNIGIGLPPSNPEEIIGVILRGNIDTDTLHLYEEIGIPIIRCGNDAHPLDPRILSVIRDRRAAAKMAVQHFSDRNIQTLGFIGYQHWRGVSGESFFNAFNQYAEEAHMVCHLLQFSIVTPPQGVDKNESEEYQNWQAQFPRLQYQRNYQEFLKWVDERPKPLGILRGSDNLSARVIEMCMAANLDVPGDIAVLSYGNNEHICNNTSVKLSSIDPGVYNQGRKAIEMLYLYHQNKVRLSSRYLIPPLGVVERASTRVVQVEDPFVQKAITFILREFRTPIGVEDIARHVASSRRKLERDFKKHLQKSVGEFLKEKRMEEACLLLRTTERSIDEISRMVGLGPGETLHRNFKRSFKITPGAYRAKPDTSLQN